MAKRKFLSLKGKLKAVEMKENGYSLARVAVKSTVHDIVKQKDKLRIYVAERESEDASARKRMRLADDDDLDRSVYLWFTQQRAKGTPVSGPVLMEKFSTLFHLKMPLKVAMVGFTDLS